MLKNNYLRVLSGLACSLFLFAGCSSNQSEQSVVTPEQYTFTDDLGQSVTVPYKPEKVVAAMGSYGELWQLSGGTLCGITEDAVSERGMELGDSVQIIGTVKEPNTELILAEEPQLVLLSTDVEQHQQLAQTLSATGIPHAYFHVDHFEDYLRVLKFCTDINQSPERYEQYGTSLEQQIAQSIERASKEDSPSILLIRAMSSKAKALKEDHLTGAILADLNADNIATRHDSLLEDLSMETIIQEDPDFIFVVPMGNSQKAMETMENTLMKNPAWQQLQAVKNENFHVLPKELFQYKPNARWAESYEYLEEILYHD